VSNGSSLPIEWGKLGRNYFWVETLAYFARAKKKSFEISAAKKQLEFLTKLGLKIISFTRTET
jgi:hypothetical protein